MKYIQLVSLYVLLLTYQDGNTDKSLYSVLRVRFLVFCKILNVHDIFLFLTVPYKFQLLNCVNILVIFLYFTWVWNSFQSCGHFFP